MTKSTQKVSCTYTNFFKDILYAIIFLSLVILLGYFINYMGYSLVPNMKPSNLCTINSLKNINVNNNTKEYNNDILFGCVIIYILNGGFSLVIISLITVLPFAIIMCSIEEIKKCHNKKDKHTNVELGLIK